LQEACQQLCDIGLRNPVRAFFFQSSFEPSKKSHPACSDTRSPVLLDLSSSLSSSLVFFHPFLFFLTEGFADFGLVTLSAVLWARDHLPLFRPFLLSVWLRTLPGRGGLSAQPGVLGGLSPKKAFAFFALFPAMYPARLSPPHPMGSYAMHISRRRRSSPFFFSSPPPLRIFRLATVGLPSTLDPPRRTHP